MDPGRRLEPKIEKEKAKNNGFSFRIFGENLIGQNLSRKLVFVRVFFTQIFGLNRLGLWPEHLERLKTVRVSK